MAAAQRLGQAAHLLIVLTYAHAISHPVQLDARADAPAGTFIGFVENGTKVWRGVPYAEAPTGKLRWKKTVRKAALARPLQTKAFGADCAQIGPAWPSLGGEVQHSRI